MKVSRLLSSILYEPWYFLPSKAEVFLPVIASWLQGETVEFEERGEFMVGAFSAGRVSPGTIEDIEEFPDDTVALVNLKGELTKYDGWCHYGANSIAGVINTLALSKNISGLVLDVDGPGGSVNAIAPLLQSMQFFRGMGKPIGVHADLMASAHYYIGAHADFIMMDNEIYSQAGSIGTMIQFADYTEYFENKGIKIHTIYAPESTHKNQEFEKALEGDYTLMKERVLSPLAKKFQEAVRKARAGKVNEKVDGILAGAMFFAGEAVEHGLADSIGTLGEALQKVSDLGVINKYMSK